MRRTRIENRLQKNNVILDVPVDWQRKDGQILPLKISAARLLNKESQQLGTVLTFRDMREIRNMENQLERSRRLAALGEMATGIAHEIRNPLGTLRGFTQYFVNKHQENKDDREYGELIIGEVDRLNRIISSLLQFARPREPHFESVSAVPLLSKAVKLIEEDCKHQEVDLKFVPPEQDIVFFADPDLMLQVLLNVLKNSLSALEKGGSITLTATQENDNISINIEDTGKGMTEDEQQRMFDPFFTTRKAGTGLGLAVTHQIVEQHNGFIDVESSLNEGTIMKIILPTTQNTNGIL